MIQFENYSILISEETTYEPYDNKYCRGILIYHNGSTYDLTYNKEMNWSRIFINHATGEWKDLPLNEKTLDLVPNIAFEVIKK